MSDIPEARPASTVVLLRDTEDGLETLLLQRNKALKFAGGLWVFPGGAIDSDDMAAASDDPDQAARLAAAREAREEAGLEPRLEDMVYLSHWTTPVIEPKRFATWIYAAPVATADEVSIDGSEIHDSRWLTVRAAIAAHEAGELGMLPPTYITLCDLAKYDDIAAMLAGEGDREADEVFPVFSTLETETVVMFRGDAGYDSGDSTVAGSRHRASFEGGRWAYVHDDVASEFPSFIKNSTT
jgi:8-oxo-dGTP pyrophosphatase MutT (NUDIX family)